MPPTNSDDHDSRDRIAKAERLRIIAEALEVHGHGEEIAQIGRELAEAIPAYARRDNLPPDLDELYRAVRRNATMRMVGCDRPPVPLDRFEVFEAMMGGMGLVLKARDPTFNRWVAIKLWIQSGAEAQEALLAEARTLAQFSHPNVVKIYEPGVWGDRAYFVMEWVEGRDGAKWLREEPYWEDVRYNFVLAAEGLAAAHEAGIQHRDFKPANMLIADDGGVLIADFGVADKLSAQDGDPRSDGSCAGTRQYMAPERLRGEVGDARSDQFSFCVSLWEALFLMRPYPGDTREELLESMARGDTMAHRDIEIPDWLTAVVHKGLAIDPDDRHEDMQAVIDALLPESEGPDFLGEPAFGVPGREDDSDRVLHSPRAEAEPWRVPPGVAFVGALVLGAVGVLGMLAGVRYARLDTVPTVALEEPRMTEPTEPTAATHPCVVDDPTVELDSKLIQVCELIESGYLEAADLMWERERERLDRWQSSESRGQATLVVARTFIARATVAAKDDTSIAKVAAISAHLWAEMAATDLGYVDSRIEDIWREASRVSDDEIRDADQP